MDNLSKKQLQLLLDTIKCLALTLDKSSPGGYTKQVTKDLLSKGIDLWKPGGTIDG